MQTVVLMELARHAQRVFSAFSTTLAPGMLLPIAAITVIAIPDCAKGENAVLWELIRHALHARCQADFVPSAQPVIFRMELFASRIKGQDMYVVLQVIIVKEVQPTVGEGVAASLDFPAIAGLVTLMENVYIAQVTTTL